MVDICGGSGGGKSGGGRSGGSSEAGTNGDAGQPGEVVRQANKVNHPNDNGITAALRKEYEPHRVTVTQANGRTVMEHINGKIEIYDQGTKAVVQKSGGKRYYYSNVIKALGHFEDLGGFKT